LVRLDARHLAFAIRSERFTSINGQPGRAGFAPLSQFFATRDGWIRLHANYPWHRDRTLGVLQADATPHAVARAVRQWDRHALEEAIFQAGSCAAAVRSPAEWSSHLQGEALGTLPLIEMRRVAPSSADQLDPPAHPALPADGVRVLDLTRVIAGPVCTRTLAALGADVLRIDAPHLPEMPQHTLDTLAGKRSALLDLRQPDDRRHLAELLSSAHVLVHGYRPGALARFGLSGEDLAARYPHLTVVSLSAWGHVGPWASRRGFDSLVQAASGIAMCEAEGNPEPGVLPAQLLDHATGYLAAAAALIGLSRQRAEGHTYHARVALARTAAWVLSQPIHPKTRAAELDPAPFVVETAGPAGRIALITPPGELDGVPLAWPRPPARYGADTPTWSAPQE
jgi:crotonobetainyl-CoA:carnitine CoA-transferase CaiB-like acyl-CoA transferase